MSEVKKNKTTKKRIWGDFHFVTVSPSELCDNELRNWLEPPLILTAFTLRSHLWTKMDTEGAGGGGSAVSTDAFV